MFGNDVLVAPVMCDNQRTIDVYLPEGVKWTNAWTGESFDGGQVIAVDAPIDQIPVFLKEGSMINCDIFSC